MRLRGTSRPSRPSRHLKRRLTTHAGEISPEGEIARSRVQAVVEPGKMRGVLRPRIKAHQLRGRQARQASRPTCHAMRESVGR
jgi:hypothetical protein